MTRGRPRELHGNYSTYVNKKCRCERCKMARRDYMRAYRAKKKAEADMPTASAMADSKASIDL